MTALLAFFGGVLAFIWLVEWLVRRWARRTPRISSNVTREWLHQERYTRGGDDHQTK